MEGDHPAREDLDGLLHDIERQQSQVPAAPTVAE